MNNRRPLLASWRNAGRSILSQSGRLLSAVGLAAVSPQVALGARKADRREDDERAKDDEREKRRDEDQSGGKSDQGDNKSAETKAESQESDDKAARQERREEQSSNDDVKNESKGDEDRSVSRRQEADTQSNDDESDGGNDRQTRELAQNRNRDDEPTEVVSPDPPVASPVSPSNPNVAVDDVPDLSEAELVIEANPDVIASVSTSGGFAFARSGDVIAVSGPDGARIIQTDEPETEDGVTSPVPDDPDDGGNNDMDFSS